MRDIPVGNGSFLVTFDDKYQIRDVYFPHVGQENHSEGFPFRFGVWVDGKFSWIYKDDWKRELKYVSETLVTDVKLTNETLGIEITSSDTVASRENVFLRHVHVKNLSEKPREIRLFLHQDFRISEQKIGDTAIYDPESVSLIHYKKNRYFLINTEPHFDSFSTGRKAFRDQEGTWRDAEDGELNGGAITEGSVDSTICVKLHIRAQETGEFYYWICAGTSYDEVTKINQKIVDRTPERHFKYTSHYWRAWVNKNDIDFGDLMPEIVDLFKRSLLVVRTQIDADGAILAANDSDVTERATDHYSYLWTRDGAFIANALDLAGYPFLTRKFFDFCNQIVHKNGYFVQKYNADGTIASGWHAMWDVWEKKKLTPIQEDETALVLWALWEHYDKERDIEFIRRIYRNLIVRCADFMNDFRHEQLNLPKPSWNLWEDRRGIHTFTVASVIAGLRAAVKFARLFGEDENADRWEKTAEEFTDGMRKHLYSKELGRFLRSLQFNGDEHYEHDANIDASMFAIFYFGVFPTDDEMVVGTMKAIEENLWVKTKIGGVARFQDDGYMRISQETTGNPWFICTLWLADYYIAAAKTKEDLGKALCILEWTTMRALPSGVLAEQVNPLNGEHASVSPLTWSHSTFVATVMNYLKKVKEFEK